MIALYVVADRGVYESDSAYFSSLARLASVIRDHPQVALQVRAKGLAEAGKAAFIEGARAAVGDEAARAFWNGSTCDAMQARFGGVHWPEAEIPSGPPAGFPAGASVHSLAGLRRAEAAGARFALFGPVFDAGSKPVAGVGLSVLRAIVGAATIPVLAIGGITPGRAADCLAAGAAGVAAVTGVLRAADPASAIRDYLSAISVARPLSLTPSGRN